MSLSAAAPGDPAVFDVRTATIGHRDTEVVHEVDFVLRPGEVVALLGPNGCGKSTLIKGMLGLARVFRGDVAAFGTPVADPVGRSRIGYVPQRAAVAGGVPVTVREVVSSGLAARPRRVRGSRREQRAAVDRAVATAGLTSRIDDRVAELSGGQQRRVLIARALVGEPDAVVMDEPMAGVDHANQELLAQTLADLVARGMTVLLVLHEIGPLEPLITRVVAMDDGRIVYSGPVRRIDLHHHDIVDHEHDSGSDPGRRDRRLVMPDPFTEEAAS